MKNLRNFTSAAAFAAAIALPLCAPASAGKASQDIVVRSQAAMADWQDATTNQLDRLLARSPFARNNAPNDTIVQVTFTLGSDGKAKDIKVLPGDANWGARQSAIYAVKRLGSLSEVPVSNPKGAKFLANLIFAQNDDTYARLAARLETGKAARFAAGNDGGEYIVIGG